MPYDWSFGSDEIRLRVHANRNLNNCGVENIKKTNKKQKNNKHIHRLNSNERMTLLKKKLFRLWRKKS